MPVDRQAVLSRLRAFEFSELFTQELGWDWYTSAAKITVGKLDITLQGVAEKRGVHVFLCPPGADGRIPDATLCAAIERQTAKVAREHLLIFTDAAQTEQVWLYPRREPGKPIRLIRYRFDAAKANELLLQKLAAITFTLNDEEGLNLLGVVERMKDNLDRDVVTKAFYQRFEKERATFQEFLEGIPDENLERWYVAVMMNRLMFIYFIQEKGFLGGGAQRYLQDHLATCKGNYYTDFLCPLFFEGFARKERPPEISAKLGQVPYLNGGIFQKHEIETAHGRTIKVPNEAFTRLFSFFDDWNWHLDERPIATGKEINPEILGYIFEKFINQKQMGAYYTKEDITGYISRNSILPCLFASVRQKCKAAFDGEASVWHLLRDDPDKYIYAPVRKGAELPLPANIAAGMSDFTKRGNWNEAAPVTHALPTENWREVVSRLQRYASLRDRLANGKVQDIDDLITHNLDIVQFAQDVVENAEPDLLNTMYGELKSITILDPTCGSGAFLFAALNILYPLYEACLNRMRVFLDQWESLGDKTHRNYAKWFAAEIKTVEDNHPSQSYFILKTIILHNIYGVDIMKEATEICKLRLFLKLAAQATPDTTKPNLGIEPLPDIDFNIRAGNTIVGFATRKELEAVGDTDLIRKQEVNGVLSDAEDAGKLFARFQQCQIEGDESPAEFKKLLTEQFGDLRRKCDAFLADIYEMGQSAKPKKFEAWLESHTPFHWFVEFCGIMSKGGFDVVIGNPPYVATSKVDYLSAEARAKKIPDVYGHVLLRSLAITTSTGRCGMIIPMSITFSEDFGDLRKTLAGAGKAWFSSFDNIPAALFAGVSQRCTIWLGDHTAPRLYVTNMHRWRSISRDHLMSNITYADASNVCDSMEGIPKTANLKLIDVAKAMRIVPKKRRAVLARHRHADYGLGFSPSARNFVSAFQEPPPCLDDSTLKPAGTSDHGWIGLINEEDISAAVITVVGEAYFNHWLTWGDGFHVTSGGILSFLEQIESLPDAHFDIIRSLGQCLLDRRYEALVFKRNAGKYVGNFNFRCHGWLTRRADLVIYAGLGVKRDAALEVLEHVQRVLAINEHAGEKAIPAALKMRFAPKKPDESSERKVLKAADAVIAKYFGFSQHEVESLFAEVARI